MTSLNMIPTTQRGNNAVMIKPKKMVNKQIKGENRMKVKKVSYSYHFYVGTRSSQYEASKYY